MGVLPPDFYEPPPPAEDRWEKGDWVMVYWAEDDDYYKAEIRKDLGYGVGYQVCYEDDEDDDLCEVGDDDIVVRAHFGPARSDWMR